MDLSRIGDTLAAVNATLNATSALALFAGLYFIRRGDRERHRASMLTAVGASTLFLVFYLARVILTGTHEFAGTGAARVTYLVILLSHMALAVVVVPLVLRLLYLAHHARFTEHARLARVTFPIWAYVSVTGLVVYLLLYRIYGYV